MTRPITPGHADGINHAVTARMDRITRTTPAAIKALHDSQPGFPSGGDGGRSGGGHSDPTAHIALEGDPVKDTLEEVTRLFCDLDRITDRLATLMPNWANDNQRWEEARRTEAAERYANASGRSVDDLPFYIVLALFRLAVLLEGSFARHVRGQSDNPRHAAFKTRVPDILRQAIRSLD